MDVKFSLEVSGLVELMEMREPRTKVEITKGARGQYRWTVTVSEQYPKRALDIATGLERSLAAKYGGEDEAME